MATLTFKRQTANGYKVTWTAAEKALKHFLRLINCDLFGKRKTNKGWTIACAATLDHGTHGDHLHSHLLFGIPEGVSEEHFYAVLKRATRRTAVIDRQKHFSKYLDYRGAKYLIKHGTDRMVVQFLTPELQAGNRAA